MFKYILGALLLGTLLTPQSTDAQPTTLTITYNQNNKAAATCARILDETKQFIAGEFKLELLPQKTDREHRHNGFRGDHIELLNYDWASGKLTQLPFLFRDAEHFQAFLVSDIYADFVALSTLGIDDAIAHAYGGFFQIFSYDAAVTQPGHFYNRFIGGIAQAPGVYSQFGGETAFGFGFLGIDVVAEDARRMASGDRMRNMVEALLISAFENDLDKNARFVNLISSTVNTIYFEASDSVQKYPDGTKFRIRRWVRDAAAKCSAENYQTEVEVIARLKQAGLQIVPFNRRAMYEAGIIDALRKSHAYWTVNDLDRIVSLGKRDPALPLPSQLLRRAGGEASKYEQEAAAQRKEYLLNLQERIATTRVADLKREVSLSLGVSVAKLAPPKRSNFYADIASALTPQERDEIRLHADKLRSSIPNCTGKCDKQKMWSLAAQGFFLSGNQPDAAAALTEALSGAQDAHVVWSAILVRDNRAAQAAKNYLAGIPAQGLSHDDRVTRLMRAAVFLAEVGDRPAAEEAIRLAKETLAKVDKKEKYMELSAARLDAAAHWALGNQERSWQSLTKGLESDYPAYWPFLNLDASPHHFLDFYLLTEKIAQTNRLIESLAKFKPVDGGQILELIFAVEDAHNLQERTGQKTHLPEHIVILQKLIAQLPKNRQTYLLEKVAELKKKLAPGWLNFAAVSKFSAGEQADLYFQLLERKLTALNARHHLTR